MRSFFYRTGETPILQAMLHLQSNVTIRRGQVRRRDFLKAIPAAALASTLSWQDLVVANAPALRKAGKACILLWMGGGPSQFETFDPKPGNANGGETKTIKTAVSGIEISENLPQIAGSMNDLCLIRSMNGKEGQHPRATFFMHTGYLPSPAVKYPTFGSIVAKELGDPASDLPSFVRIGAGQGANASTEMGGAGILGVDYDPLLMTAAGRPPENTALATDEKRFQRRLNLLGRLQGDYANHGGQQEVSDHQKIYAQASRLVLSPKMEGFNLDKEPQKVKDAYGSVRVRSRLHARPSADRDRRHLRRGLARSVGHASRQFQPHKNALRSDRSAGRRAVGRPEEPRRDWTVR